MIVDRLENWNSYPFGLAWQQAFDFLRSLKAEVAEAEYPIQGSDIFARVMSYNTRTPQEAVLEAHQKYIDIQTTLVAAEGIEWFPLDKLEIKTPYEAAKDVAFYHRPRPGSARVEVYPGSFVALFPHDAHMPQLIVDNAPGHVKKVVVKINVALLRNSA